MYFGMGLIRGEHLFRGRFIKLLTHAIYKIYFQNSVSIVYNNLSIRIGLKKGDYYHLKWGLAPGWGLLAF